MNVMQAIEQIKSVGLDVEVTKVGDNGTLEIVGGSKEKGSLGISIFGNFFSIRYGDNCWYLHAQSSADIIIRIQVETLEKCVQIICDLYSPTLPLGDSSMSLKEALDFIDSLGFELMVDIETYDDILCKIKNGYSSDYIEAFSIYRHGSYYVTMVMQPKKYNLKRYIIEFSKSLRESCMAIKKFHESGNANFKSLV